MKYIRTKDGKIIDRTDFTCWKSKGDKGVYVNGTLEDDNNLELFLKYKNTTIIKQADTIEELCDKIVYVNKEKYKDRIQTFDTYQVNPQEDFSYNDCIYAAIYVEDKGIIFVAKMKGILSNGEIDWKLL